MMEVTITKHRLTGNFTQISNAIIEDTRLSCEAYRLLSWILHCPPDYQHCFDEWQEVIHAGIRKLKKVLAELEAYGYLKQIQKRNEYGQFMRTEYQFFDSSSQEDFTVCPKPSDRSCKDTYYYNNTSQEEMSVLSVDETETLNDCIQENLQEVITEQQELKEKVSLIPNQKAFISNLTDTVKTALLRLKHPKARKKFIKNTIINQITEYRSTPQATAPKPHQKKVYGAYQNVFLTAEQFQSLVNEHGSWMVNSTIKRVSEWCNTHGITGYDGLVRKFIANNKENANPVNVGYRAENDDAISQRVANFGLI